MILSLSLTLLTSGIPLPETRLVKRGSSSEEIRAAMEEMTATEFVAKASELLTEDPQ